MIHHPVRTAPERTPADRFTERFCGWIIAAFALIVAIHLIRWLLR